MKKFGNFLWESYRISILAQFFFYYLLLFVEDFFLVVVDFFVVVDFVVVIVVAFVFGTVREKKATVEVSYEEA